MLTYLKFMFSKKVTKIDEIFTVDLTVTTYCQIDGEDFVNFVAFSENVNFDLKYLRQIKRRMELFSKYLSGILSRILDNSSKIDCNFLPVLPTSKMENETSANSKCN